MTQIIKCKVENILGAKDVEFAPNGHSVTIGGKNGQGKSSAIHALIMALGGKKQVPEMPVHNGANFGKVMIELDKFTVEMTVDSEREVRLVILAADGIKYATPRKVLDDLFGNLSFDPGEFRSLDRERRVKVLLDVLGLDLSPVDFEIKKLSEERKLVGREYLSLKEQVSTAAAPYDGVPDEEISIEALTHKLKECQEVNRVLMKMDAEISERQNRITFIANDNKRLYGEIEALRLKISQNEQERLESEERITNLIAAISESLSNRDTKAEAQRLFEELSNVETINSKVRQNKIIYGLSTLLQLKGKDYDALEDSIKSLREQRELAISSASLPIEGLSFADGDVTLNSIPFAQLSESEQWKVSTAIGFALNKNGIVFLKQSGGLDSESRQAIRDRAAACGVQLFLEVVDDAQDVQVLIEEGVVKENRLSTATRSTQTNESSTETHYGSDA